MSGKKVVFLLGAGFTHAVTNGKSPLTEELGKLLGLSFDQSIQEKYNFSPERIEQFLTHIDIELQNVRLVDEEFLTSNTYLSKLYMRRQEIREAIYQRFKTTNFCNNVNDGIQIDDTAIKVQKLLFRKGDTIITTNYDCYLENLLWINRRWSPAGGYGKCFVEGGTSDSETCILKLHGSVNFHVCSNNKIVDIYFDVNHGDYNFLGNELRQEYWGVPGHIKEYMIAPSFVKSFNYKRMLRLWEEAGVQIETADALVVIGSGLREEDYALWLLLSRISRKASIFIVDPSADVIEKKIKRLIDVNCVLFGTRLQEVTVEQAEQIYI